MTQPNFTLDIFTPAPRWVLPEITALYATTPPEVWEAGVILMLKGVEPVTFYSLAEMREATVLHVQNQIDYIPFLSPSGAARSALDWPGQRGEKAKIRG